MEEILEFNKKVYLKTFSISSYGNISIKILESNGVLDKAVSNSVISEKEILEGNDYIYPEILNFTLKNCTTENIDFITKQIGAYDILFVVAEIDNENIGEILDLLNNLEQDSYKLNIFIAINSKNIKNIDSLIEENFKNLTSYMRVENAEIALQGVDGIISSFSAYQMIGIDFAYVRDFLFGRKISPLQVKIPLKEISKKEIESLFENTNTEGIDEIKISILGNENLTLSYVSFVSETIKEKLDFLEEGNYWDSCSIDGIENEVTIIILMAKNMEIRKKR